MRIRNFIGLLLPAWLLLAACSAGQPKIVTVEVPHVVREIQYVTVEVPRIEREIQFATVVVTQIVRETVVVTPAPPPEWRLDVSQGVSLGIPRTLHSATRLNDDRILLAGGSNGVDDHYALVEIFEPASGTLIPAAPLNTSRHEHSATLLPDGRVLVVGGYNAQQQWLVDAEVYDPLTNTWTVTPPIYSHGVQHTATLLPDGRVLLVGGCIGSGICTDRVELFDPQTNAWTEAASLASDLGSHAAVLLDDGRVLVAGGAGSTGYEAGGAGQVYDPLANLWTITGPMVLGRAQAPMIKLLDGRVMAAGGISISDNPIALSSVEIYDPVTNNWTEAASLAQPRYAHNLATLADGQVLALGGAHEYDFTGGNPWTEDSFIRELESYDPGTDRWYNAGKLVQPEAYAATVSLPDGRLWVTGGGAGSDMGKAWAETWLIAARVMQP